MEIFYNMNKKILYIFLAGLLFAVSCYLCFSIGQSHPKFESKIEIIRDTLTIRDTITIEKPVEKIRWKEKDRLVYIPIIDTLIIEKNDTTYIAMQEERVEYKGEEYRAIISGIDPRLEEISVYPKTVYISETQKQTNTLIKYWSFNITAGPGVIYDFRSKQISGGVGIVVGFGYNF